MKRMSSEEQLEIAAMIGDYHSVFFTFFEMADVMFSDKIRTAAVRMPRKSKPELTINEEFWKNLNLRERLFVICHECMHVILDHGVRNGLNVPGATPQLVNIAQDITINEMIVDLFQYDREDIRDWKKFCWIDTCFDNHQLIKRNETFLYYLQELIKDPPADPGEGGPSTLDEHGMQNDGTVNSPGTQDPETQEEKEAREDLAATLAGELSPKEIENIIKSLPENCNCAGKMSGLLDQIIAKKIKKLKINFTYLIRKLKKSSMKEEEKDVETFTHDDRRFDDVMRTQGVTLPGKNAVNRPKRDRLLTAVFMDVSGSCMDYFNVFQKVFLAFDEERTTFDTRLFIFDTKVTEVKSGDGIRVGGGTFFNIIEDKCRELESQQKRYPDCVIVITDGHGNVVQPKAPTKWIWLLTPKDSTSHFVPPTSRHYLITQITFGSPTF